jgi:hypothetical protein
MYKKETYGMTQNKMVWQDTGRFKEKSSQKIKQKRLCDDRKNWKLSMQVFRNLMLCHYVPVSGHF